MYLLWISMVACCLACGSASLTAPLFVYHDQEALAKFLKDVTVEFPELAELKSIGKSVQGRDLWVLTLGSSPRDALLRPDLNVVGNIHGNEASGREVLVHFIYYLVTNYQTNSTVKTLLDNNNIQILAAMNPDGFANSTEGDCTSRTGRNNANDVDLNRNFPDYFTVNDVERQPETAAVMKWAEENNFVLHISLHDGVLVVNYPYDNYIGSIDFKPPRNFPSISRDDDMLIHISKAYSYQHPRMTTIRGCDNTGYNYSFAHGITNGADWYPTPGTLQDWIYIAQGAPGITAELGCCKYPLASQLETRLAENKNSLFAFLQQGERGVRGVVSDSRTGEALSDVQVEIVGRDHPRLTTVRGEYWRVLLPGSYTARFSKSCHETLEKTFVVPDSGNVRLDVTLVNIVPIAAASEIWQQQTLLLLVSHSVISLLIKSA